MYSLLPAILVTGALAAGVLVLVVMHQKSLQPPPTTNITQVTDSMVEITHEKLGVDISAVRQETNPKVIYAVGGVMGAAMDMKAVSLREMVNRRK